MFKYIHLGQDRKSPSLTSKKRRVKTTTTTQPDSTDMGMTIEPSVLDTRPDKANRAGSCCYWHDSSFQFQEDGACYVLCKVGGTGLHPVRRRGQQNKQVQHRLKMYAS